MAKDRSTDGPCREADEVGAEGQERGGRRIGVREIKLAENQSGGGSIEEEVVPFNGSADGCGNHRLAQLPTVVRRGKRVVSGHGRHAFLSLIRTRPILAGAYS